jgi:hypothetical protein
MILQIGLKIRCQLFIEENTWLLNKTVKDSLFIVNIFRLSFSKAPAFSNCIYLATRSMIATAASIVVHGPLYIKGSLPWHHFITRGFDWKGCWVKLYLTQRIFAWAWAHVLSQRPPINRVVKLIISRPDESETVNKKATAKFVQ